MNLLENSHKPQILVVDDEEEIRSVIAAILMEDFNVLEAENGKQAIDVLKHASVDVIMTDYNMPVLNGLELLKSLNESALGLPIIVLTGRGSQELHRKTVGLNVTEYMEKPFHPEELIRAVKTALALRANVEKPPVTPLASAVNGELCLQLPKSVLKKFEEACMELGISMSTRLQELIEQDLKEKKD